MKKILVIEYQAIIRLHLLNLFKKNGFNAIGAEDGYIGLKLSKEFLPDLILCDIKTPKINSYKVLEELRADPVTKGVYFVFITTQLSQSELNKGTEIGADGYIVKPFKPKELLQLTTNILKIPR